MDRVTRCSLANDGQIYFFWSIIILYKIAPGCTFEPEEEVVMNPVIGRKKSVIEKTPEPYYRISELDKIEDSWNFLYVGHWLKGELGQDRKDTGMLVKVFLEFEYGYPTTIISGFHS